MKQRRTLHLNIGELAVCAEPAVISTVLGSCVSVCLYESSSGVGGMIHFSLPQPDQSGREDLRYASDAIPRLVGEVCRLAGAKPDRLKAKIVGGGAVMKELAQGAQIGVLNAAAAERILKNFGVHIVSRDLGGQHGRKIYFYTDSGRLRVALIPKSNGNGAAVPRPAVARGPIPLAATSGKKRVLIVDDSKTIQTLLGKILSADPRLEVAGVAMNARIAAEMLPALRPDVITLDIHMPEMDGIAFLKRILPSFPIPTVMISSLSFEDGGHVLNALELGAVDYIQKPSFDDLEKAAPLIREKVHAAALVKKIRLPSEAGRAKAPAGRTHTAGRMNQAVVLAIGASTGGTEAITSVLTRMPKEIPPTVIVQHIPAVFSAAFARRLNDLCPFEVKEAADGDKLEKEKVLIAPGGRQMAVEPAPGGGYRVRIKDDPPVSRHKPSVDYLFDSVAHHVAGKAIGVILTGMGSDGAAGLLKMRKAGARTLGQDEASAVVYGMPKVAFEMGAVQNVCSLDEVPEVLVEWLSQKRTA